MLWIDKIISEIGTTAQHIDDMKTPSGYPHVGSLRGPILQDAVAKALKERNPNTINTYVINDFDVMDGLSADLIDSHGKYMGYPLRMVPAPEGDKSFAEYYGNRFKKTLKELGVEAEYYSSWDMYRAGKFNSVITEALDNAEKIQNIYYEVAGSEKKASGWLPLQVICPKCNRLGTTKVTAWDGYEVTYICEPKLVTWAEGCGHSGTMSPFDGNAKLPWKVDWPAHWKVMGVTFEGAGKDHASRGGSYDIARAMCEAVFDIPKPYYFPYEFFIFGGRKMSSSKGIGVKAKDMTTLIPPELVRFLLIRPNPRSAIDFDPNGLTIPDLFDEFDKYANKFWESEQSDEKTIFKLSKVNNWYDNKVYLPRFRDVATVVQLHTKHPLDHFEEEKGEKLSVTEKKIYDQRLQYAKYWLKNLAPDNLQFHIAESIPEEVGALSIEQKQFLGKASSLINKYPDPEQLQIKLYEMAKEQGLGGRDAFQAIYISLIGKSYGPKAAWLISSQESDFVKVRFEEASIFGGSEEAVQEDDLLSNISVKVIKKPELFTIDKEFAKAYPSVSIGIAVIKGVTIEKQNKKLQLEVDDLLSSLDGLTTSQINEYPELQSYRKLYKETGINWHSRRPSPEALLRRIATGKGLYNVNTCVDAYNLIVMKHRVSIGAFDYDKLEFPTMLRFAKAGETIHLLGDKEPIEYKEGEVAYFDRSGGYNIDFNYRDAIRTSVQDDTKNLLINIDGILDITPEMVQRSLVEVVEIITKYCGGNVEFSGVVKP